MPGRRSAAASDPNGVVTVHGHAEGMRQVHPQAAVCVVRAERQETGLLITLVINVDIDEVSPQRRLHFADIDAALAAVRNFLVQFEVTSP
jgi:hypothetical protein